MSTGRSNPGSNPPEIKRTNRGCLSCHSLIAAPRGRASTSRPYHRRDRAIFSHQSLFRHTVSAPSGGTLPLNPILPRMSGTFILPQPVGRRGPFGRGSRASGSESIHILFIERLR